MKTDSCRRVKREFLRKFVGVPVSYGNIVCHLVNKFRKTGSLQINHHMLTEDKLYDIFLYMTFIYGKTL